MFHTPTFFPFWTKISSHQHKEEPSSFTRDINSTFFKQNKLEKDQGILLTKFPRKGSVPFKICKEEEIKQKSFIFKNINYRTLATPKSHKTQNNSVIVAQLNAMKVIFQQRYPNNAKPFNIQPIKIQRQFINPYIENKKQNKRKTLKKFDELMDSIDKKKEDYFYEKKDTKENNFLKAILVSHEQKKFQINKKKTQRSLNQTKYKKDFVNTRQNAYEKRQYPTQRNKKMNKYVFEITEVRPRQKIIDQICPWNQEARLSILSVQCDT